jgi:predicted transcriptional regulator
MDEKKYLTLKTQINGIINLKHEPDGLTHEEFRNTINDLEKDGLIKKAAHEKYIITELGYQKMNVFKGV